MPKRSAAEGEAPRKPAPPDGSLAPWLKCVLSLVLAGHVLAVFLPPFAFACRVGPSSSPFADAVTSWLSPYIGMMYLDHGYFFFAPGPGPTHLVKYKVEFEGGREPVEGRFPDLQTERPRLLYHRHFMMSEALNNAFVPPTPPPEPSPPPLTASAEEQKLFRERKADYALELAAWKHSRRRYESLWDAYEQHLQSAYGGSRVTLTRIEHGLPFPWEVADLRKPLDDPASYTELPETLPPDSRPAAEIRRPLPSP